MNHSVTQPSLWCLAAWMLHASGMCSESTVLWNPGQEISEPTWRTLSISEALAVEIKSSKHHKNTSRLQWFPVPSNTMVIFLGVISHGENADLEWFFDIICFLYKPEGSEKSIGFTRLSRSAWHKMLKKPWSRVLGTSSYLLGLSTPFTQAWDESQILLLVGNCSCHSQIGC